MAQKNLNPVKTKEEARERGRNGGIKSGEVRRAKKTMRETAKMLMKMAVQGDANKRNLELFGIEKNDQNYQTAVVVRLLQKALVEGDNASIRLLGELTGDLSSRFGIEMPEQEHDVIEMKYPSINIPDNGRDKKEAFQIAPQAGPQTMFLATKADIAIYGGAAGGGKTYALLIEFLRHRNAKGFGGVIFRKNYNQITAEGGLWDASNKIYSLVPEADSRRSPKLHWRFGDNAKLNFAHLEREEDLSAWQGTEIPYIAFDELTHFSRRQFLYMLSRNRTTCGVKPYIRATCNPDADSWVADFISWWIDQETGYAIPERSGQVRYMCVLEDTVYWGSTPEELSELYGINKEDCKSVTFIASKLEDNKILMEKDPSYIANLKAMTKVDMERLLKGNWKIKKVAGSFFNRSQIGEILDKAPDDIVSYCRGWDLAATDKTENDTAAFTAGVLMGIRKDGRFVILNVINQQLKAGDVRKLIKNTAKMDNAIYGNARQRIPKDPGQAGKDQAESYVKMLAGYDVVTKAESGDKVTRAEPFAAQWQHGNVDVVAGEWNEMYFNQLESFPDSKFKDMVDASSSAFNELTLGMSFNIDNLL